MGKTTSAERMRKLREKLKQDKNKCESFKEKERVRDKKRREKMKLVKNLSAKSLMEYRRKETERKRKYRQKIKEKESRPIGDTTIPEIGSFKCPQSLGKAVTKVKRVLPLSPRKRIAVLRKLVYESSPQASKTLFDKSPKQNTKSSIISQDNIAKVHEFYNSDDISRQAPGIKDVKSIKDPTSGKRIKIQKRHMNMTVQEAYALFKIDNPTVEISKSKFYELRPKNIDLASQMPHNVCVCKYHANFNFLIEAISRKYIFFPSTHSDLLSLTCCDLENEKCMNGECKKCVLNLHTLIDEDLNMSSEIFWKQWKDDCSSRPKVFEAKGTIEEAVNELQNQFSKFKKHFFVKRLQAKAFKNMKDTVADDEVILQVDFAENYLATSQDEIQSAHWTHNQITVFTGCAWTQGKVRSFAVVSDHLTHDKYSVYACLKAIIEELKKEFNRLTKVKIFSDGCAGQFKNKYTLSNLCFMPEDFGVDGEWFFFATSHGKGAVDGIGGLTKQAVWNAVKQRRVVINSASDFVKCAEKAVPRVKFVLLTPTDISANMAMLDERWTLVRKIPNVQSNHFFKAKDKRSLVYGPSFQKSTHVVFTELFKLKVSDVYRDSDSDTEKQDGVASCTNETDVPVVGVKPFVDGVTIGTYVLVEFETTTKRQRTRPTKYRYAAICQSNVEDDGEVKVMCMRAVNNSGKLFQVDEKDISYVQFEHILSILPQPNVKRVRRSIFYEFTENVDVFESG